jgi:hypothetical protein
MDLNHYIGGLGEKHLGLEIVYGPTGYPFSPCTLEQAKRNREALSTPGVWTRYGAEPGEWVIVEVPGDGRYDVMTSFEAEDLGLEALDV